MLLARFSGRRARLILLAGSSLILLSCGLPKVGGNIERASENLNRGVSNLADAVEHFDAIGVKTLLNQNAELKGHVEELKRKLALATEAPGTTVIPGTGIFVEVVSFRGTVRINGWIDSVGGVRPFNQVLLTDGGADPPFNFNNVFADASRAALRRNGSCQFGNCNYHRFVVHLERELTRRSTQHALKVHRDVVKAIPNLGSDLPEVSLERQLGSAGPHELLLQVTPIALDKAGTWGVRFRYFSVVDGKEGDQQHVNIDAGTDSISLGQQSAIQRIRLVTSARSGS